MPETDTPKIGVVLLAAGGSSRFGSAKQLYEFEGETLLRRAANAAVASELKPIVVVLGAEADAAADELRRLDITAAVNEDWPSGMSGSMAVGLAALLELDAEIDAVMVTLCDLPNVGPEQLRALAGAYTNSEKPIAAASYDDVLGVPAVFASTLFPDLLSIEGDKGAREIIRANAPDVLAVNMPEAAFDLDVKPEN